MASALEALFGGQAPITTPPYNPSAGGLNKQIPLTAPEHKGIFGMHGGLRDVIGILGDALSKSHTYSNARQGEKESDALINFGMDPLGAVQNMMNVNPDKGMALQNMLAKQEAEKKQAGMMEEYRKAQAEAAVAATKARGQGRISAFFGALKNDPRAAESYKRLLPGIKKMAADYGLSDYMDLPEEYDPNLAATYAYAGMSPKDQFADEDRTANVESQISDRTTRQAIARERNAISANSAAVAHGDRQASLAEKTRHNQESEKTARDRATNGGKGKPKVQLAPPPGFRLGRRIN